MLLTQTCNIRTAVLQALQSSLLQVTARRMLSKVLLLLAAVVVFATAQRLVPIKGEPSPSIPTEDLPTSRPLKGDASSPAPVVKKDPPP